MATLLDSMMRGAWFVLRCASVLAVLLAFGTVLNSGIVFGVRLLDERPIASMPATTGIGEGR